MKRIFKLFVSVLVYWIDQFRIRICRIFGCKVPAKHIILYYHTVRTEQRESFAKQLDEINRLARPFSLGHEYPDDPGNYFVALTFDDGFASFLQNALPELKMRDMPFTVFVPTGYIGKTPGWMKTGSHEFGSERVMNEEELRELGRVEIATIGSHCITHRNLKNLTDDEARHEIFRSKADLERILERKVAFLSFPHGGFNPVHIAYAKEAGYERAFSIIPAPAFESADEYVTGRIDCDPMDWPLEFRLKFHGAYRWMRSASEIKNRLRRMNGSNSV